MIYVSHGHRSYLHRVLKAIRRRAERLEGLEQDRDALMEFYADAMPEDLERLKTEERCQLYGMLRLEVSARPDGTLVARGVLGDCLRIGSENGRGLRDRTCAIVRRGLENTEE